MPFFEKSHSFTIHQADMNDAARDTTVNRSYDSRQGGHNFSGKTDYKEQKDNYNGRFNGGNFGGSGKGGQGYQGLVPAPGDVSLRPRGGVDGSLSLDSDEEQSEDEEALLKEIERKKALLKSKKADRLKKLKAEAAALDAQLAELNK
ncbi:hypothetical protein BDQ17DRAFT_1407267 [Cyathus striatus]|nr:hypothetical protein BDQ17DRAFT_1407267 [Cyathus striatus]